MKIRNNKTREIIELNYHEWSSDFLNNLYYDYTVINMDIVLLRKITTNGDRVCVRCIERAEACQILKQKPKDFDFVEIQGGHIVNAHTLGLSKSPFRVIRSESVLLQLKNRVRLLMLPFVLGAKFLTRYLVNVRG